MAFNINEIKSQLALGGARPSLFQVTLTNPVNAAADLKFPFMCRAAQMPASTLGTIEVPYFGRKVKIAGDRTFAEWTVTLIQDEDMIVRNSIPLIFGMFKSNKIISNLNEYGNMQSSIDSFDIKRMELGLNLYEARGQSSGDESSHLAEFKCLGAVTNQQIQVSEGSYLYGSFSVKQILK